MDNIRMSTIGEVTLSMADDNTIAYAKDDITGIIEHLSEIDDTINCQFNEMALKLSDIDNIKHEVTAISDQLYDINDRLMINTCLQTPAYINSIPKRLHEEVISLMPRLIQYLNIQSEELCDMIIAKDISNMKYILYGSDEFFLKHVKKSPEIIQYIQFPSISVSYAAVDADPMLIKYLWVIDEHIWGHAIEKNPYCINVIKNPTYNMYHKALTLNIEALNYESSTEQFMAPSNSMLLSLINDFPTLILHLPKDMITQQLIIRSIEVLPWIICEIYDNPKWLLSYNQYLLAYKLEQGLYDYLPIYMKTTFEVQLIRFKHFLSSKGLSRRNV